MGDRANVYVHDGPKAGVYLYTHNCGWKLPEVVREALSREQRWDDEPYLTRIIFSEMIKSDILGETGFGISTTPGEGPIIDVDISFRTVYWGTEETEFKRMWFRNYISKPRSW